MTHDHKALSLRSRFIVVLVAIAAGLFFGRDVIASGLVARSDSLAYSGASIPSILTYVDRARLFDPTYPAAAKRFGQLALRARTENMVTRGIGITALAIERAPRDTTLQMVHAQLLFVSGQYRSSALAWAALADQDPRTPLYRAWAAEAARHADDCELAIKYFGALARRNPSEKRAKRELEIFMQRQEHHQCLSAS